MPPLVLDLGFHFIIDVVAFVFSILIQVNVHLGNEVAERIDYEFHVRELISKS
jgi:hypothetical protein